MVRVVGCEGARRQRGRGRGELGQPAMAATLWHASRRAGGARGAMERQERVSGVEGEPLASTRESAGALVHAAWRWNAARAWPPRTGHASSVGAFPRTPGDQWIEHGGAQVWASYGPIWFLGAK